ncbi:MAG: hypothetical protein GX906_06035 [Clostridiales bacterium]|nr:hypothetical protein [Clostridiales bacterium]
MGYFAEYIWGISPDTFEVENVESFLGYARLAQKSKTKLLKVSVHFTDKLVVTSEINFF